MHIVTKILIVFCAVLSLLLAALTMAYASNASAVRAGYQQIEQAKLSAEARERDVESNAKLELARYIEKANEAIQQAGSLQKEITDLQAKRTELKSQVEQARAEKEAISNRIQALAGANENLSQIVKVQGEEVTRLRDEALGANRREIELTSKINDLEGAREVLEQNLRAIQEQLRETQLALQNAKSGNDTSQSGVFEFTGPLISARVTDVSMMNNGSQMVTIDQGSNRNIKENMLLNIVRGDDQFVATIVVIKVDPHTAVGRVETKGKFAPVQAQDRVLSSLAAK